MWDLKIDSFPRVTYLKSILIHWDLYYTTIEIVSQFRILACFGEYSRFTPISYFNVVKIPSGSISFNIFSGCSGEEHTLSHVYFIRT